MNSEAVNALIAKNPTLKASKAKLEAMKAGSYVIHNSWGFGQIKSYNEGSQRLIIDFLEKKGHSMDPAFCVNTMQVLNEKHLLVRKQTEAATINKLITEAPAELIVEALKSYPNHATTAIDLELTLAQVVGQPAFKKWWTAAKKAIARDPRIVIPEKKTECYILREVPIAAEDEIEDDFNATRSARRRIALAEELLHTLTASKNTKKDVSKVLDAVTEAVKNSNQLDAAQKLYGAHIRDSLARHAGVDVTTLEPSQGALVANQRELGSIAEKIPVQFQGKFLDLVKEAHPGDYIEITFGLLKNSQGKFTTECINFLVENEQSQKLAETLKRWQTEQNLRAPVLQWIIKNRNSKKFAKLLQDLIAPRLLSSIFYAIDYEALQAASARRIPLAEMLSDDLELIGDLLREADPETARDLASALLLNQGFEELTKKSLLARFIKIFPAIQSLVASDAESKEEQLLVSRESYERKREEYETIKSKKIPENSRAIAAAREHGDLKENSEYKMAKQDQQVLMAQKAQLEKEIGRARITDFTEATTDQVSVGSVVDVKTASGKNARYTILGAWDSIPEQNIIAYKTPLGLALLSKKVGDTITVKIGNAEETYTVTAISRYVDAK
ncbi:GreA/GreB family elongation factor [Ereboglobus sp. PH5-5]|uniref:GreA/GreB family elongation factor n=1 Tax=Ereboglobus sp. PH5-5 TaxID=2940529 RepID=UPI002404F0F6|nr:GreA/GreB family elongation factor [Ereboglobus sp. PH5-5]